jgi:hypothetical protein
MNPEIAKHFIQDPKTKGLIYNGDTPCKVSIWKAYERFNVLSVANRVRTMAFFNIEKDGTHYGFNAPILVNMYPTETVDGILNNHPVVELTFNKGDIFIETNTTVKLSALAYVLFYVFINSGKLYPFQTYDKILCTLEHISLTKINPKVSLTTESVLHAQLMRTQGNIQQLYRQSDMSKPPVVLPLRAVAHAAASFTARTAGSYFNDGLNSSLVNQATHNSEIEDLLRR